MTVTLYQPPARCLRVVRQLLAGNTGPSVEFAIVLARSVDLGTRSFVQIDPPQVNSKYSVNLTP